MSDQPTGSDPGPFDAGAAGTHADDGSAPSGAAAPGPSPYGYGPPQHGGPYGYGPPPSGGPYGYVPPQHGVPYGFGPPQHGVPYGYGPQQYEHPQGTMILILGILGIVACQLCSPFAWVMGTRALEEIDANPGAYSNRGIVVAGRICGIVGCVLLGLGLLGAVLYIALIAVVIGGSSA